MIGGAEDRTIGAAGDAAAPPSTRNGGRRASEVPFAVFAHPTVQLIRFLGKYLPGFFVAEAVFGEAHFAATIAFAFSTLAVLGLDEALIGARAVSRQLCDRVRRMHLVSGTVAGLGFLGLGMLLAHRLQAGHPGLSKVLLLLAPHVLLQTQVALPTALLVRDGRYRALFVVDIASVSALAAMTLVGAALGMGAASLVLGWYGGAVVSLVLALRAARTVPLPDSGGDAFGPLLTFGRRLGGANVAGFLSERVEFLAVGARASAAVLGVFEFTQHLCSPLAGFASTLGTRLLFPRLAAARADGSAGGLFLAAIRHVLVVWVPAHIALAVFARPFVQLFVPDGYAQGAAALLGILPLVAAVRCLGAVSQAGLRAAGKGRWTLWLGLAEGVVLAAVLLPTAARGAVAVAWAALAIRTVIVVSGLTVAGRDLGLGAAAAARALGIPAMVLALFAGVAVGVRAWFDGRIASPALLLAGGLAASLLAWTTIRVVIDRPRFVREFRRVATVLDPVRAEVP